MGAKEVAAALGGAEREGRNWRCVCPLHGGRGLYLRDGRNGKLLVKCWADCDSLAVLADLRQRGLLDGSSSIEPPERHRSSKPSEALHVELALRIWRESVDPDGTLVERYLAHRGLALSPRIEEAIQHLRLCPFKGEKVPAMIALLRDIRTDEPCGIHRTPLLPDSSDRDRSRGKAMLGRSRGAAIKISPDDEVTLGLGLAEGIETAVAIIASGWCPVWAAASANGIAQFPVLDGIEELTIFADCDANGVGQRAARACAQRWHEAGRLTTIRLLAPFESAS